MPESLLSAADAHNMPITRPFSALSSCACLRACLPDLQAWDNAVGQNMVWNRNTGLAAFGVTAVVALTASFTEAKPEKQ